MRSRVLSNGSRPIGAVPPRPDQSNTTSPDNIRVASYIRNSEEEANPERQRATISGWLGRHGFVLGKEYHDQGGRRHQLHDEKKRPDWHNLIRDIKSGSWDLLVVDDCTRLGFITHRELVEIVGICEDNGVQLWEASTDRQLCDDDITSIILNAVKADRNKCSSRTWPEPPWAVASPRPRKGVTLEGSSRTAPPFPVRTPTAWNAGASRRTPATSSSSFMPMAGSSGSPASPRDRRPGEEIYQVLSKYLDRRAVVQRIFAEYTTQAISANAIAMQLNREGIKSHTKSGLWYGSLIARTLRQPLYTGRWAFGKWTAHRYATVVNGVATNIKGNGKAKRKDHQDWVWTGKLFDGIVSQETLEAAQARLSPHTKRAPSNPDLWLSGLVFCSMCSGRMSGWHAKNRNPRLLYRCDTYVRLGPKNPSGCWPHQISHDILVHWIDKYLADTDQLLGYLTSGAPEGLLRRFWSEGADCRERLESLRGGELPLRGSG